MKQKSLRQIAKELGVSASYLSQVNRGKRPPSQKVLSRIEHKVLSNPTLENTSPRGDSNPLTYRLQIGCAAIAPLGHCYRRFTISVK